MKKFFLIITSVVFVHAADVKQEYVDYANQFSKNSVSSNVAGIDYAEKFQNIANDKVGNQFKYLQGNRGTLKQYKGQEDKNLVKQYESLSKPKKLVRPSSESATKKEPEEENSQEPTIIVEESYLEDDEVIVYQTQEDETPDEIMVVNSIEEAEEIAKIEEEIQQSKDEKENFFENLKQQNRVLDNNGYFTEKLNDIYDDYKENEKTQVTIFYFASSDMKAEAFKSFVEHIKKLKKSKPNIIGRVLFRGLIDGTMDGITFWLKKLEEKGLKRTADVKYQFHPWAFKHFELERVPAYVLSTCKRDFTFRTCDNKYLVKGDISLVNFFEFLSEQNEKYKEYYFDLIKAES